MKLSVSLLETNRFTPRNKVFQALKHFVYLYEQVIRNIGMQFIDSTSQVIPAFPDISRQYRLLPCEDLINPSSFV